MTHEIDYIIVGQGIAGTSLAYTLLKKGKKILVIDNQNPQASSKIAAGLFNPITGRRMTKTWMADLLFPYFTDFYQELEKVLRITFLYFIPMYRPFHSIKQQNTWLADSDHTDYILRHIQPNEVQHVNAPLGGLELKKTGYVDLPVLLQEFRSFLEHQGMFVKHNFVDHELLIEENHVIWRNYQAHKIIFCRGVQDYKSKWFTWLPFRLTKGEILDIQLPISFQQIINKKCWIIPKSDRIHRVGSTYDFHQPDYLPTEKSKQDILDRFRATTNLDYKITAHTASVRPTTNDRRLLMGKHPKENKILIFNGLGTKGVSQAPYFADIMYHFLEKGIPIPEQVNIDRHHKLYV